MYLKITGIVLIMMSASLMGYLFSKDYIERINRLEQIQKMLILLKGEISYSNNSVQEALENISEMIEGKVGEFVTKVQESFKKSEIPLSVAWSLGVDNIFDKKSSLKSEDKNSLKDFGRGLGITDRQTQINNIEKYQSQIQLTIKELKAEKNEKCKLYRMLGITCGAFLGISSYIGRNMDISLIFKIAAVGIIVSVVGQILKHSGREEQAFLTSLAGLILVLMWIVPYIYELFSTIQRLFEL